MSGNRVAHRHLRSVIGGLRIEAVFTVESDLLILELSESSERPIAAIGADAWRLAWALQSAMMGAAAVPTLLPGRNGDVRLPML